MEQESHRTHRAEEILVGFLAVDDSESEVGRLNGETVIVDAFAGFLVGLGSGDVYDAVGAHISVVSVNEALTIEVDIEVCDGVWRIDLAGLDVVRDGGVEDDLAAVLEGDAVKPLHREIVSLAEDTALEDAFGRHDQRDPLANRKVDVNFLAVVRVDVRICCGTGPNEAS